MTKLLFINTFVRIKVNESQSPSFCIEREMHQGCFLHLYFFLIVVEVLNYIVKEGIDFGRVLRIILSIEDKKKIIAKFVDDTSFTLKREEDSIRELFQILNFFCMSSSLILG